MTGPVMLPWQRSASYQSECSTGGLILDNGVYWNVAQQVSTVKFSELDEEGCCNEFGLELVDELDGSGGRAACGKKVVDEQYAFTWEDGVLVDLNDIFTVFEGVGH